MITFNFFTCYLLAVSSVFLLAVATDLVDFLNDKHWWVLEQPDPKATSPTVNEHLEDGAFPVRKYGASSESEKRNFEEQLIRLKPQLSNKTGAAPPGGED